MLIACWSAKGGSGTTVVSVALGLLLARGAPGGALIVDLAGDVPAALGMAEPSGAGVTDWLAAGADVEGVLGVPVRAVVEVDSTVARAVDAGLLAGRLPAGLERALRNAA